MSAQPRFDQPFISPQEYLATERAADFKNDYYQGQVYARSGASYAHNLTNLNVATALNNALAERDCTVQVSDMRLQVKSNGLYTYPDISVVCGPVQFADQTYLDTLLNPVVLGEVISKTTGGYDREGKFMLYKDIPTLRHYLLIECTKARVRLASWREPKVWAFDTFEGLDAVVPLPALGVALALRDIYRKVTFPE